MKRNTRFREANNCYSTYSMCTRFCNIACVTSDNETGLYNSTYACQHRKMSVPKFEFVNLVNCSLTFSNWRRRRKPRKFCEVWSKRFRRVLKNLTWKQQNNLVRHPLYLYARFIFSLCVNLDHECELCGSEYNCTNMQHRIYQPQPKTWKALYWAMIRGKDISLLPKTSMLNFNKN